MYDREKAINTLVSDDFFAILKEGSQGAKLEDFLKYGFTGYNNIPDDKLMEELEGRGISYLFGDNDD
jgi:hypothetical protein